MKRSTDAEDLAALAALVAKQGELLKDFEELLGAGADAEKTGEARDQIRTIRKLVEAQRLLVSGLGARVRPEGLPGSEPAPGSESHGERGVSTDLVDRLTRLFEDNAWGTNSTPPEDLSSRASEPPAAPASRASDGRLRAGAPRASALDRQMGNLGGWLFAPPARQRVLDTLDELGVPARPRLVSAFAAAVHRWTVPAAQFSSLRRDDRRAYERAPASRPAWIVPAIDGKTLAAVPRIVANSSWAPERRVLASQSLVTHRLRSALAILQAADAARDAPGGVPPSLERLAWDFVESLRDTVAFGAADTPAAMRDSIHQALERIEPADLDERREAAARLHELPPVDRLWGRRACAPRSGAAVDQPPPRA